MKANGTTPARVIIIMMLLSACAAALVLGQGGGREVNSNSNKNAAAPRRSRTSGKPSKKNRSSTQANNNQATEKVTPPANVNSNAASNNSNNPREHQLDERPRTILSQKRITSVFTTTGAEGSRVTVASDQPLNDSEAYTRGDRFYVKIPSANLPTVTGSLLGRGFDDVQIQRSGDGILLSFRLQPGSTARIDRKLNRLEIVVSVPPRNQNANSPKVKS